MNRLTFKLEKRLTPSPVMVFIIPLISVLLALLLGAVFLSFTGQKPLHVYSIMFGESLGSKYGLTETMVKAIPLMLTSLGVSLAFKMQLWNIGAEGQLYMGAFGASFLPLTYPHLPIYLMLPGMIVLGMIAGGLWALLTALPRAIWKVNEIITSLMLNYVAILWVDYLVYGPWKDPKGSNFPISAPFPDAARLPGLGDSRIHAGLFFALALAMILAVVFKYSRWGYSIKVIGSSERAARYAGMNIKRNIYLVMFISGAISGLAGMTEVSGIIGRLQHGISPGYGYSAIIVAWLSKLNPLAILLVSVLFGALQVGGYAVQLEGVPAAVATMMQGAILFFVLGGEVFTNYRVKLVSRKGEELGN
ncbi:ABC transporter permease [Desulfosporosinus metallidurans]|uniref:Nucleoside ABC transporter, permease protein 2 n=1 Tax=Desulfosporosinus metallidurans TaxID=1888891 RepID=A0A1Q8QW20_9FIRM|nr:ABC transporter permease [Desulfosporosinus metallidurans]OLN31512.1 Nucleoside ABC transporter, permease protein 2 [Desulfosporosinus metallidurans]